LLFFGSERLFRFERLELERLREFLEDGRLGPLATFGIDIHADGSKKKSVDIERRGKPCFRYGTTCELAFLFDREERRHACRVDHPSRLFSDSSRTSKGKEAALRNAYAGRFCPRLHNTSATPCEFRFKPFEFGALLFGDRTRLGDARTASRDGCFRRRLEALFALLCDLFNGSEDRTLDRLARERSRNH
jgi:hypothetical protein